MDDGGGADGGRDLAVTVEDLPGSVVHVLVDDAAGTSAALGSAGFTAIQQREVVVVDVENRSGVLGVQARRIADAGVSLDLAYLATGTRLVLGTADVAALCSAL